MSRLTLDNNHSYRLDGVSIPGVTEIMQSTGLIDFPSVPASVLEAAGKFGKAVHYACELYDRGTLDEDNLDSALIPYLTGWKLFCQEYGFAAEKIEWQVYSPVYRFAGTIDRVGYVCGDNNNIIITDIKSGIDSPAIAIQTAAYELLVKENLKIKSRIKRLAVFLNSKGTYNLREYKDKNDINVFLACLSVYNWRRKNNGNRNCGIRK